MAQAHPLSWPSGWPRTKSPQQSRFSERGYERYARKKVSMTKARDELFRELNLLGVRNIVLSTNLQLRLDGLPRANQKKPDDTGVAVYFTLKDDQKCFPCDKWNRVEDNIWAIAKTINALRGIERWGSKKMVDATFSGFKALPNPNDLSWRQILGIYEINNNTEFIKSRYRSLVKQNHPDRGGDPEDFNRIQKAFEEAKKELGF